MALGLDGGVGSSMLTADVVLFLFEERARESMAQKGAAFYTGEKKKEEKTRRLIPQPCCVFVPKPSHRSILQIRRVMNNQSG